MASEQNIKQLVCEFVKQTGADEDIASTFLEAHEYDLKESVEDYTSQMEADDDDEDENAGEEEEGNQAETVTQPETIAESVVVSAHVQEDLASAQKEPPKSAPEASEVEEDSPALLQATCADGSDLQSSSTAETPPNALPTMPTPDNEGGGVDIEGEKGEGGEGALTLAESRAWEEKEREIEKRLKEEEENEKQRMQEDDDDFHKVDEVAQRIGKEAAALAADAAHEVQDYLGNVTSKVASTISAAPLQDIGKSFSSWWSSIDASLGIEAGGQEGEAAGKAAGASKAGGQPHPTTLEPTNSSLTSEVLGLFPSLSTSESLIEQFPCKLLQTYACSHNTHTPDIQMAFQGTMYITDKHTCFNVEENGRTLPITIPHTSVSQVERQRPARKSDKNDVLRLVLEDNQYVAFKDFSSGHLDSALALLEHLCESNE